MPNRPKKQLDAILTGRYSTALPVFVNEKRMAQYGISYGIYFRSPGGMPTACPPGRAAVCVGMQAAAAQSMPRQTAAWACHPVTDAVRGNDQEYPPATVARRMSKNCKTLAESIEAVI